MRNVSPVIIHAQILIREKVKSVRSAVVMNLMNYGSSRSSSCVKQITHVLFLCTAFLHQIQLVKITFQDNFVVKKHFEISEVTSKFR